MCIDPVDPWCIIIIIQCICIALSKVLKGTLHGKVRDDKNNNNINRDDMTRRNKNIHKLHHRLNAGGGAGEFQREGQL